MDASRRDAVVARVEALRRRLAREPAAASCRYAVAASAAGADPTDVPLTAASARVGRTASEQAVFHGATAAAAGHAALAQSEVLADTTPSRFARAAAHRLGLDGPMSADEKDELVACLAGLARRRREAETEGVAAHMRAFLRRTDLDTMSVRSVAVVPTAPDAARHDCTVKEEPPDVKLHPLPRDMDSNGALRDILAEDPADEAPTEASGVAGQPPVMEADTEVTSSASQFEAAAGLESDVTPDDGLVRDFGEQTLPYVPDGIFQGAHGMDAEDMRI